MESRFDLTYLDQVFHGNEAMVGQIVTLFLEQAPHIGSQMTQCVQESRWSDLHPLAHKLKSSVKMLGIHGVLGRVLELERISKLQGDSKDIPAMVTDIVTGLRAACDELAEAWIGRGATSTGWQAMRRA
ncbi:MAG: Hpt domain-containing protein [Bacteroidetes bacterium]|nr:Hpt domain-containing protein [Bacteroidota bacterium]MDA0904476.1 Hpt domain-containing protein [Bacteroidota bacterium]MDA1241688.1 Hpt domain-containing protein [Bacteroidota bacterium]